MIYARKIMEQRIFRLPQPNVPIPSMFYYPVLCALLCGCGTLVPKESQKSQSVQATENLGTESERTIRRVLEVTPQIGHGLKIQKDGIVTTYDLPAALKEDLTMTTASRTGAGSTSKAEGSLISSIPLGVKLALIGIGIAAIVAALAMAWKYVKNTALGQGISLGDEILQNKIRTKRAAAMAATDAKEIAQHNAEIAEMEAERGRLAAKAR